MARLLLTALAIALLPCLSVDAQDHQVGSQGARLTQHGGWKRQTFNADIGNDQFTISQRRGFFTKSRQAYALVMEVEGIAETDYDFERILNLYSAVGHEAAIDISPQDGYVHASRRAPATIEDAKFFFRLDLLAAPGLSYLIITWSLKSDMDFLESKADELVAGFEFPDLSSRWQAGLEPVERGLPLADRRLSFSIRPSVLHHSSGDPDRLLGFTDADEEHGIFAFESEAYSTRQTVEQALEACQSVHEDLKEVARRNLRISDVDCELLIVSNDMYTLHLIAVPIAAGEQIDLRYVAPGPADLQREDRDLFLESLRITQSEAGITLPDPVTEDVAPELSGTQQSLFDKARPITATGLAYLGGITPVEEGQWLASGDGRWVLLSADESPQNLVTGDGWSYSSMLRWQDRWLVTTNEGKVHEILDGSLLPELDFTAAKATRAGDGILLVRDLAEHSLAGIPRFSQDSNYVLLYRDRAGAETELAHFGSRSVTHLATDPGGTTALLVTTSYSPSLDSSPNDQTRCLEIELDGSRTRELGTWHSVQSVAPGPAGWLITGRPQGRPMGLYELGGQEQPRALLTGSMFTGVHLSADTLLFASDATSGIAPSEHSIFAISRSDLAELGPRIQPFAAQHLNSIAAEVCMPFSDHPAPSTEAELRRLLKLADRHALELTGRALPRQDVDVDALIAECLQAGSELQPCARVLLAMLITVCNLDQGAVWVESDPAGWSPWLQDSSDIEATAYAVACQSASLISDCLDDSEGWWDPGTGIQAFADGRELLFGLDRAGLVERLHALTPQDASSILDNGDFERVLPLLEGQRANHFFRQRAYQRLLAAGHLYTVEQLARHFCAEPDPEPIDFQCWLAAWSLRIADPEDAADLVDAALRAVRRFPTDPHLYLVLAEASEKATPEQLELARTCYHRVVRLQPWGQAADVARAALERLDG